MGDAESGGKVRVAVIFGGRGGEHARSCASATYVLDHLDPARYDVVAVGITPSGEWVLGAPSTSAPLPDAQAAGRIWGAADVVFPLLHGPFGAGGPIQGLLEMAGVPYVGPRLLAGAAARDGEFTGRLLAAAGLPVAERVVLRAGTARPTPAQRADLGLPVVVRPAQAGAAGAVGRVMDWAQLNAAVELARERDPKVIVEAAAGRGIACGVLEFPDGSVRASVPVEVHPPDAECGDSIREPDIPAKLDDAVAAKVQELAVAAFEAIDGRGLAGVDLVLTAGGALSVAAVDTTPEFGPESLFPRAWAVTGLDPAALLQTLIEVALVRGAGVA